MAQGRFRALAVLAALPLAACGRARTEKPPDARDSVAGITLTQVARGLENPVYLTAPAGDPRLFVVEQNGRIVIAKDGGPPHATFLDIRRRVGSGGERGLLSIAFHPRYAENGRLFVNYTDPRGDTHVSEFHATGDTADPGSERELLLVRQPFANHNGGHILFGPDGRLYVGMGDGGAGGDPGNRAQSVRESLGKLLRLDVDGGSGDRGIGAPEVWAIGLRNPWRFWFDSGLIYIADVGQNRWEEISVAPADSAGINYGWRVMEGSHCFINPVCAKSGLMPPAIEYAHDQGCSVIGGVVYRGTRVGALAGHYLYSDYCEGWLRSFRYAGGAAREARLWTTPNVGPVLSFGEDGRREAYLLAASGVVYRIDPAR